MKLRDLSKNNSGIILLIVMWTLVILTTLAISLGRSTHIELSLTKYSIGKMKSKYLAWAGLQYAMNQLYLDGQDEESQKTDTLAFCGIPLDSTQTAEEMFKEHSLEEGFFNVLYEQELIQSSGEIQTVERGETQVGNQDIVVNRSLAVDAQKKNIYGFIDEERKLNINAITLQNYKVLVSLLKNLGVDSSKAEEISYSVVDWTDADSDLASESNDAEDEYYLSLEKPYRCKNLMFDSLEELLLVKGMDKDVFDKAKDLLTVFPKDISLKVNFDTASDRVLKALALSVSGASTNTTEEDAVSLVDKMILYRNGSDGVMATADDLQIDSTDMGLNSKEKVLLLVMNQFRVKKSNYFNIKVEGSGGLRDIVTTIEAVVQRDEMKILAWKRY